MPRYKVLKSIAHNLGHSYLSLMNYIDGDYIVEYLFKLAKEYNHKNVTINILESKIKPPEFEIEPIKKSLVFYKKALERLLNSEHLNLEDIKAAIINIDYNFVHRQWSKTNPDFELSVYTCEVVIEASNGKTYSAIVPEWWKY